MCSGMPRLEIHVVDLDDHLSHTAVALESLIAIYALGAYIVKRRRFEYLRLLLSKEVRPSGVDLERQTKVRPLSSCGLCTLYGESQRR